MADQEGVGADFAIGVDRHEDATVVSLAVNSMSLPLKV